MRRKLLLFLVILFSLTVNAQRERKCIYVFDCTTSMKGFGGTPNIIKDSKKYLSNAIKDEDDNTEIVVVLFQDKVSQCFESLKKDFPINDIQKHIDKIVDTPTHTDICGAFSAGVSHVDKNKDNYLYILTDGIDNVRGTAQLQRLISATCDKLKNTYGFYVMLTKNAVDPGIIRAVENCESFYAVEANAKPRRFGSFTATKVNINALEIEKKVYDVPFSTNGKYRASVSSSDPNIDVELVGGQIVNGKAVFRFKNKYGTTKELHDKLGEEIYRFNFKVNAAINDIEIINPEIEVIVINKEEKILTVNDGSNDEYDMGKAHYYPSFLFSSESEQQPLTFNIKALFNNEAKKQCSTPIFQLSPVEGENRDFKVLYNDKECPNGEFKMNPTDVKSIISIIFDKDASSGTGFIAKRHFTLSCKDGGKLDRINNNDTSDFEMPLRAAYSVGWNPLKTILVWTGIVLLAILLIWLLMIKPIMISKFKAGKVTFMGPDSYFYSRKINGSRRVIMTSKPQNDKILKRIFLGETVYVVSPVWTKDWSIEPARGKNVRCLTNKSYIITPSSILAPYEEYEIMNIETNKKSVITIN